MKKNVLVSILAAASVPMAGFANSDVSVSNDTKNWSQQNEGDLKIDNGVLIVSTGTQIKQNIGTLVPGTYKFSCKYPSNVNITVAGKDIVKAGKLQNNGEFKLTAETANVEIVIVSTDKKSYEVSSLKLEVVFDFAAAKSSYNERLNGLMSKMETNLKNEEFAETYKKLMLTYSTIFAKLNKLVDDDANAYKDAYVALKLYAEKSVIDSDIDQLEVEVNKAVDAKAAYAAAMEKLQGMQTKLATVEATLSDQQTSQYAKNKYKATYEALAAEVIKAKSEAEKNLAADADAIAQLEKKVNAAVAELLANIATANNNDAAYNRVAAEITKELAAYNAAKTAVAALDNGYEALKKEAAAKMAEEYQKLVTVQTANGTAESHDNATAAEAANMEAIAAAAAAVNKVQTDYTAKIAALKAAKTLADDNVKAFEKRVTAVEKALPAGSYKDEIAAIKAQIDKLKEKIETANAVSNIDEKNALDLYITGKEYTTLVAEIEKSITGIETVAAPDIDNYNAYKAVSKAVESANAAVVNAKAELEKLVSKDKTYKANEQFAQTADKYAAQVATFKTELDKANADLKAVDYQKKNEAAINNIIAEATDFVATAKAAVAQYDAVKTALDAYEKDIAAVEAVVVNQYVNYAGSTKTYGEDIAAFKAKVSAIKGKLTQATTVGTKADADRLTILNGIQLLDDATVKAFADLAKSYPADKAEYDKVATIKAAQNMYDLVVAKIQPITNSLNAIQKLLADEARLASYNKGEFKTKQDEYTKKLSELTKDMPNSKDEITDQKKAEEVLPLLSTMNDDLGALDVKVVTLKKAVDDRAKFLAQNDEAYAKQLKAVEAEEAELAKVAGLVGDDNRTDEFKKLIDAEQQTVNKLKDAMLKAQKAETFKAEWDKTMAATLETVKSDVVKLTANAKASAENRKAYDAVMAKADKARLTAEIDAAKTAVAAVAKDKALDFYTAELDKMATSGIDNLVKAIEKAYKDRKAVEQKDALLKQITDFEAKVKGFEAAAKANEEKHAAHVKLLANIQQTFNDAYQKIQSQDQSSQKDTYLDRLIALQTKDEQSIDVLAALIADKYAVGEAVATDAAISDQGTSLTTRINEILSDWSGGYDAAVVADNAARKVVFDAALSTAEAKKLDAVNTINKFNGISNQELRNDIKIDQLIEALNSVYAYDKLLGELQAKANKEYNDIKAPELYDQDEENTELANKYAAEIDAIVDGFVAEVNANIASKFDEKKALLDSKVKEYEDKLQGYNSTVIKAAFADVRDYQTRLKKVTPETKLLVLDELYGKLTEENLDKELAAGLEPAAEAQWNKIYADARKTAEKHLKDLAKFSQTPNDNTDYKAEYEKLVANYLDKANASAAKAIADGKLFGALPEIQTMVNTFNTDAKALYENAKSANKNQTANVAAYNELNTQLATLGTQLTEALAYADDYAFAYLTLDGTPSFRNTLKAALAGYQVAVEEAYNSGNAKALQMQYNDKNTGELVDFAKRISLVYQQVNNQEVSSITTAINKMRVEYTNMHNKYAGTETGETLGAYYAAHCEGLTAELTGILNGFVKNEVAENLKKDALLPFEKKVAKAQVEFTATYNKDAETNAKTVLDTRYNQVVGEYTAAAEALAKCHKPIQEEYALTAIKAQLDGVQSDMDTYAGQISFYSEKMINALTEVSAKLKTAVDEFTVAEKPYAVNETIYQELTASINALDAKVAEMVETVQSYGYYQQVDEDGTTKYDTEMQGNVDFLTEQIVVFKKLVDADYTAENIENALTESKKDSYLYYVDNWTDFANGLTYTGASAEVSYQISTVLNGALSQVWQDIVSHNHAADLSDQYNEVVTAYNALYETHQKVKDDQSAFMSKKDELFKQITAVGDMIAALANQEVSNRYVLGDVTGAGNLPDGKVTVSDRDVVLNIVLDKMTVNDETIKKAADANLDGRITVSDVVEVNNIIRLGSKVTSLHKVSRAVAMKEGGNGGALSLSETMNGTVRRIAVNLTNAQTCVAFQMDVKLPAGMTLVNQGLTERADGHRLYTNNLANGAVRLVGMADDNAALLGNQGAVVYLDVAGEGNLADVKVNNISVSDMNATDYVLNSIGGDGQTTGINGVEDLSSLKQRIYSVGGQIMNKVKKGINIIRNANGSTKKVIK